jgi:hypothetical protein
MLGGQKYRKLKDVLEAKPKHELPPVELSPVEEIAKIDEKTPETTSWILLQMFERNRIVELCADLEDWRIATKNLCEMIQLTMICRERCLEMIAITKRLRDRDEARKKRKTQT